MKPWKVIATYALLLGVIFLFKDELSNWMVESPPSPLIMFLLAVGLLLFPVLPYKVMIGLLGYLYGPIIGAIVSWSAACLVSLIVFLLVRTVYQERGRLYLTKIKQLDRVHRMLEQNPFMTLLLLRMIPLVPQFVMNIYPAFLSIRTRTYFIASALGKIPAMLVFSFIGSSMLSDLSHTLLVVGIYALFLLITYIVYRIWFQELLK